MNLIAIKSLGAALAFSVLVTGQPLLASSYGKISDETRTEITAQLSEQGYEVRKMEEEDGLIEVYAIKDGARFELYLDSDLNVVRTKQKN